MKYLHVLAKPLQSAGDEIEFAGAAVDITEAKQAEERIRRSEKELQSLVEAIPAYVGTNLPDGSLDFISQSWLDYTGLSREQWNLCVIATARSFSGTGFRLTSMRENERKILFATRGSASQRLRGWRPSLNLRARSLTN
jgi:PAS domain-containing protein